MEDTDKKRFAELMAGLAQTFATDISQQDLENYWRLLRGHPLEQIEQAIIGYCTSPEGHRFMPKPGELISAVHGKQNEQSLLAWVKVTKGIRQAGASKTVIFDDPVIHAVIADLGGWIRLCRLTGISDTANAAAGYEWSQKPVLLGDPTLAALVYKNGTNHLLPSQALSVQQILQLSEGKLLCENEDLEASPPVKEKALVGDHHDD